MASAGRRVRVRYDNTHPVAGSHHQRVVVIDDRVAFCGDLDLTSRRWDTCDHRPGDERRKADDIPYPPFHDLMIMVDGEAARALGTLARERWRLATDRELKPARPGPDSWPLEVEPQLRNAMVVISRTLPPRNSHQPVREIEALYLDMIAAARHYILIENQYLTAHTIGEVLAARLNEPDGPEIIVVVRLLSHGWLEEVTMQNLRRNLIDRLEKADHFGRFHVYYSDIEGLEEGTCIDVHSKATIVDDEWLRVGSAKRLQPLDGIRQRVRLLLEARGRPDAVRAIRDFRNRLLAEHLGVAEERVATEIDAQGSMSATIERLGSPQRTLKRLENSESPKLWSASRASPIPSSQ